MTSLPFDHASERYSYLWGWPSRRESASDIAARLQQMVQMLAEVEPAYGELWAFGVRVSGPGPVPSISPEDLATLIDRRARFDPPQRPAPVGEEGYSLSLTNGRQAIDALYARLRIDAGRYRDVARNAVELQVQPNGPAWQDEGLVRRLFDEVVGMWDARWAAVWHRQADEERVWQWPRFAWSAEPLVAQAVPPYDSPYPFPFPFDEPPAVTTRHYRFGGELEEWR